jgi:hypothetical protein
MEDKVPFHTENKVYSLSDLKPKFVIKIEDFFRKQKLKLYKNKKIKEAKTEHERMYHIKFNIKIEDDHNPQIHDVEYEMVVPARASYFAKKMLEKTIKRRVYVNIVDIEEMSDEEIEEFESSREEFINRSNTIK